MTDIGWGILILGALLLMSYSGLFLILIPLALFLVLNSEFKRTGRVPDPTDTINRIMVGRRRRG